MVETYDFEKLHETHPQGPPPIIPPPTDGPDDGNPHDDEGRDPRRFPLKHAHLFMLILIPEAAYQFASQRAWGEPELLAHRGH